MKQVKPRLAKFWSRWSKALIISLIAVGVIMLTTVYAVRRTYHQHLQPVSQDPTIRLVTIPTGSSVAEIADILKAKALIRSERAFGWYVRSQGVRDNLLAGSYALKQSQSTPEIVEILRSGKIATDLVTILPSRRLDQIRADLVKAGFSEASVDKALKAESYADHPALADKPQQANLEGYLYPESFQKTAQTTPEFIIRQSLDQMALRLKPELRAAFAKRSLSIHEAIIVASIVEKEISYKDKNREQADRAQVAQVFLTRQRLGMRLESDPTASYGAILAGATPSNRFDSDYNTYLRDGLPPGPISNVSESSLQAVANPSETDWLYFVSSDECFEEELSDKCATYFSRTLEEHRNLTNKYCNRHCVSS